MVLLNCIASAIVAFFGVTSTSLASPGRPGTIVKGDQSDQLQRLVKWDEHSLFVRGERILFYSGEFHPFRLPVPSLWLDIFQKIKALGYSAVSFYVDWALLEGQPGHFRADGIFSLDPFFDAASEAGIYLLARPGPYINAEVSGGGFPGWLQRINGTLRTNDTSFLHATDHYASKINSIIAKAQITNGGPVVLFQPENEYTYPGGEIVFPNGDYFAYVEKQARDAGIVVPFINNDASAQGLFAPGNGTGSVDIYGHDSYPLGFDCANPYVWPDNNLPRTFGALHEKQSPLTPYSIVEFQGGSFDPWGGSGFAKCLTLVNEQYERVFYKNDFSFGITIFNLYMTFGGTNWGNLGHPGGYTSYDYGSVIAEDQTVAREKYSEAKLLANSLRASPAYLTATPGKATNGSYVNTMEIAVTPLFGNVPTLGVSTSLGNVTIPQKDDYGKSLVLSGRDSKIHVTDFDLRGINLLYSSAEIFSWQKDPAQHRTALVLFGGEKEVHEFAITNPVGRTSGTGSNYAKQDFGSYTVVQFKPTPGEEQVIFMDGPGLVVYMLWRNDVYNWWSLELPTAGPIANYTSPGKSRVIINGGHLMRTAVLDGSDLYLTGDVNMTTTITVVAGAPQPCTIYFNGQHLDSQTGDGSSGVATTKASLTYRDPQPSIPDLAALSWRSIDSLPEVTSPNYDDSLWTPCNQTTSNNPLALSTPSSLYASDYGYHAGSILYRGHFTTSPSNLSPTLTLLTQGGYAYATSVYLNSTHLTSFPGVSTAENHTQTIPLPALHPSTNYTLTVVTDHMGLAENFRPGADAMKQPRGILSSHLSSYPPSAIEWKITGNLGGECYHDRTRGPLNEGGFYIERQGYHLPYAPTDSPRWTLTSPYAPTTEPGVRFFVTTFPLSLPTPQYAIPLAFQFSNTTTTTTNPSSSRPLNYRCVLYVNGYQYGKYVNNIGPQTLFPVPEGILNYTGNNTVGVLLWNMETQESVSLQGFKLVQTGTAVLTGRGRVENAPMDGWVRREGAY